MNDLTKGERTKAEKGYGRYLQNSSSSGRLFQVPTLTSQNLDVDRYRDETGQQKRTTLSGLGMRNDMLQQCQDIADAVGCMGNQILR